MSSGVLHSRWIVSTVLAAALLVLYLLGRLYWAWVRRTAMRLAAEPIPYRMLIGSWFGIAIIVFALPLASLMTKPDGETLISPISRGFQYIVLISFFMLSLYGLTRMHFRKMHLGKTPALTQPMRITFTGWLVIGSELAVLAWFLSSSTMKENETLLHFYLRFLGEMFAVVVGIVAGVGIIAVLLGKLGMKLWYMQRPN